MNPVVLVSSDPAASANLSKLKVLNLCSDFSDYLLIPLSLFLQRRAEPWLARGIQNATTTANFICGFLVGGYMINSDRTELSA